MTFDPIKLLSIAGDRAITNLRATWDDVTLHKSIRIVMVVCVYLLVRPYLISASSRVQMAQHEREAKWAAEAEAAAEAEKAAKMSANDVRGLKVAAELPPVDDEEEEEEADTSATNWGAKARKRQRRVLRKLVDAEERRLAELQGDDEDKDIEEFLEQ
jgi:hypothetical protein